MGISIISLIILLGVLIFFHEFGHYLTARLANVGVLKFSLGFGPKIFGKKIGETEYVLSAIPLGGYVKLLGESEGDELSPEDEKRSFLKQSPWKRIMIAASGPFFNFILAIFIYMFIYMYGVPVPTSEIGNVTKDSAAMEAGLMAGDKIITIDNKNIHYWEDIRPVINEIKEKEVIIVIERAAKKKELKIKPRLSQTKNIIGEEVPAYILGITSSDKFVIERKNPWEATINSLETTWQFSELTIVVFIKMVKGEISPRNLGGPIFIAQTAGKVAKEGIIPFLVLLAILSINLGVINLFPIPILDGGHVLFNVIELIRRKPLSAKAQEIAQQIGLTLIVMLMIFVIMIDIERMNFKVVNDVVKYFK
jgi:regulator of sigma E protease